MIQFITQFFKNKSKSDAGPTKIGDMMTLDERKDLRLSWIHKSIRSTFMHFEIVGNMARYRVLPIDTRYHYYIVVIETSKYFEANKQIVDLSLIEEHLKYNTYNNYGIVIDGVYWRASWNINIIPKEFYAIDQPTPKEAEIFGFATTEPFTRSEFADTQPFGEYTPLSESEEKAFKDAIAAGVKPPVVNVNNKKYTTDYAPLGPN